MSVTDQYARGIALYQQGQYDQAIESLTAVAGGSDLSGRLGRYYLGRALRVAGFDAGRAGDLDGAVRFIRQAAEAIGPTAELTGYLANLYARTVVVPDRNDDPAEQVAAAAMEQYHAGRPTEALMTLQQGCRDHRQSASLHLSAGMILAGQDRLGEARRHFLRAIECDCSCPEAYRYLGLCDGSEGRFATALGYLQRALSLRPADLPLAREVLVMARAAACEGETVNLRLPDDVGTASERDLDRLAELIPVESDLIGAFLALPAGPADEEIFGVLSVVMDVVLTRHGDYADMQHRQALVHQRLGRDAKALRHARKAVAINGEYVQGRFLAGSLLLDADPTGAAEHLRRAVTAGGDYADVHATLGLAYQRLGQIDAARLEMRRSLEINENYAPAAEALQRMVA